MDELKASENRVATGTMTVPSVYVPPLQLTAGQPAPIAANGGLSYMAFERDRDQARRRRWRRRSARLPREKSKR